MKRWGKLIVGAVVVGLAVGLSLRLHSDYVIDKANRAAEAYAGRMQASLLADPRFSNVVVYRFSGTGIAKYRGNVVTATDLTALQRIIDQSSPPSNIAVVLSVHVGPPVPAATRELR